MKNKLYGILNPIYTRQKIGKAHFWHLAQTISARHYLFARPQTEDFSLSGHGSNFCLAPLISVCFLPGKMADRQQAISLHRALSVKYALHQNGLGNCYFCGPLYCEICF